MNHSVQGFFTQSIPLLKTSAYCYCCNQTKALIKTPAHCYLPNDAGLNLLKFKIKSFPFVHYITMFGLLTISTETTIFRNNFPKKNLNYLVSEQIIADDDDLRRKKEFDHLRQTDFEVGDFFFRKGFQPSIISLPLNPLQEI